MIISLTFQNSVTMIKHIDDKITLNYVLIYSKQLVKVIKFKRSVGIDTFEMKLLY